MIFRRLGRLRAGLKCHWANSLSASEVVGATEKVAQTAPAKGALTRRRRRFIHADDGGQAHLKTTTLAPVATPEAALPRDFSTVSIDAKLFTSGQPRCSANA